jgi:16S rRNA (guanine(966)-N(2))-methyltransferase RsmD
MRIIGGKYKGRRFTPPADKWPTRPTTDFAKEGLFNILHNRFDLSEVKMLDIFGGTGNHSYEAISRGCCDVTYVDQHRPCVNFVEKTAQTLGIANFMAIHLMNASTFLQSTTDTFDYIFAGPPYRLDWLHEIPDRIFRGHLLKEDGLLVLEHDQTHNFEQHSHFEQIRKYGGSLFSFFTVNQSIAE